MDDYRFAADRMIGRLARMLRLLGYDTLYQPELNPADLAEAAQRDNRIILTRGETCLRFHGAANVFSVVSEYPPEQLREVVGKFSLNTKSRLWTRCTVCNGSITPVPKEVVESLVKPKVYEIYSEFYRCSGCGRVYWHGSHVQRIRKNLSAILPQEF